MRILIVILFAACPMTLFSQANLQEIEKEIANELDSAQKGSAKTNDYHFNASHERPVLYFIKKYENAQSAEVRFRIWVIKGKIAMQTKDSLIRQQVVEDFLNDILDPYNNISQYSLNRLLLFKEKDFSIKAKKTIVTLFKEPNLNNNFFLLIGIAQIKELMPQLIKEAANFDRNKNDWYSNKAWYACLALARMGDVKKIDNIISAVELELDPVFRVTQLLRQVAYTRQADAIILLRKYLESSEHLPSVRYQDEGIGFNQYALEYLAENLKDFPIDPVGIGYTKEQIEIAKAFLKKIKVKKTH